MKTTVGLLCCLILAGVSRVHGQRVSASRTISADDTKEILRIETALLNTYISGDVADRERYAADEFVVVDRDGGVTSKQGDIQDIKERTFIMKSFKLKNEKVSLLAPDVALLTYDIAYEATDHGVDSSSPHSRVATLYRDKDGLWKAMYTQETPVKDASVAGSASPEPAPSGTDSFFIDKEKQVWEAIKKKDKAADSRLLADDFVGLYDTGFATRSDHVSQMDDNYSVGSYTLQDAKVLHLSPTMVLLLYKATCKGSGEWAEFCSSPEYISSLWAERSGRWVALFSQDTPAGASEQEMSAQALAKEKEILETLKRNDWPAFSDLLADDVVAIDADGIVGKKELLDGIKTAGTIFSDYKMENVKVIPQANGAIVAYRETLVGTQNGKPFTWHIYTHSHWERRGDKWLMTMFQDSMAK